MSNPMRPAATLILLRDRVDEVPELLMLERAAGMAFAAGALVFPGGRVDEHDFALAARLGAGRTEEPDDLAARIAAIRETIEETGVAVGVDPLPDPAAIESLRDALHAGRPFAELIDRFGLSIDFDALSNFARWQPPVTAPKRFDTRFYVAAAPQDAKEIADGSESVRALWSTAHDLIRESDDGRVRMMWPTLANLARIGQFRNFAETREDAIQHGHHLTIGWSEIREGLRHLCIPDDIGYPISSMPVNKMHSG